MHDDIQPDDVLSGEAATDLRALAAMADADPNVLPDPDAPVEPIRPPLSEEIAGMLLMLANMAAPMFPSLKLIYTPEACQAVGASVQPVCEKYGWMQDGIGGEYGPEIMCVCVVGPMAFATYTAVKNDNEARKAKAEKKPEGQPAKAMPPPGALRAPGSDTVTFGAPIHENQ